jgi:hypothetical protein
MQYLLCTVGFAGKTAQEVFALLKEAGMSELARSLPDLFGCTIHENRKGSGLYVNPQEAQRSVCGCETQNLRLELCANELRATLALPSGELLRDLPVVDAALGRRPRRQPHRSPGTLLEFSFSLQDHVLPISFHPARPHAAFSRSLLADARYFVPATQAEMA